MSTYIYLYDYIYLYLSISIHIYLYLSIYLCLSRSIYPSMHLCIYASIHLSVYPHTYLPTYLPTQLSICLSIYLSICLSIYLSIYLSIHPKETWDLVWRMGLRTDSSLDFATLVNPLEMEAGSPAIWEYQWVYLRARAHHCSRGQTSKIEESTNNKHVIQWSKPVLPDFACFDHSFLKHTLLVSSTFWHFDTSWHILTSRATAFLLRLMLPWCHFCHFSSTSSVNIP